MDSAQDTVQQLCELLQSQALEPAQKQAQEIVEQAKSKALQILEQAQQQALATIQQAKAQIEQEQQIANASLKQAAKQVVQHLRQELEQTLFSDKIKEMSQEALSETKNLSQIISAYIQAIHDRGISADFSAQVCKNSNLEKLSEEVGQSAIAKLKEGHLLPVLPQNGVKIQLHDAKITIDASSNALEELLSQFLRKNLRERFFN